jgi:hypothetical protein
MQKKKTTSNKLSKTQSKQQSDRHHADGMMKHSLINQNFNQKTEKRREQEVGQKVEHRACMGVLRETVGVVSCWQEPGGLDRQALDHK